jgi:RNA polymerase sigma-70 factor (sigma-E family)
MMTTSRGYTMVDRSGYTEFATARAHRLFQTAYLMCGDWYEAQDLVQATLAKLYVSWRRIERQEHVEAYARQVLLRTFLSSRRLRRSTETPVAELPVAAAVSHDDPDLRVTLLDALRQLPPRNRAVVVLRYLEGLSIDAVAESLGMTPSAVKSLNTRSLAMLRESLGRDHRSLFQ